MLKIDNEQQEVVLGNVMQAICHMMSIIRNAPKYEQQTEAAKVLAMLAQSLDLKSQLWFSDKRISFEDMPDE